MLMSKSDTADRIEAAKADADQLAATGIIGEQQATVWVMRDLYGFSRGLVAEECGGISKKTVTNTTVRAREIIRNARQFVALVDDLEADHNA